MKYIKMLGLLAVAAAALMAFAGVASATTITSNHPENPTTPPIKATSIGHTTLHNLSLGSSTTCAESTVEGKVESHGAAVTAAGKISKLTFGNCGTSHVTVLKAGSLEVHPTTPTGDGTLTSSGAEITILNTTVGISCIYKTNNTHIGTVTGSNNTGGHAVFHINSAVIPREGHSAFCGSSGQWTGTYTVVTPSSLSIH